MTQIPPTLRSLLAVMIIPYFFRTRDGGKAWGENRHRHS